MNEIESRYDVFISYSRDDGSWVRRELYEPLLRCRTRDGRKPRVFFDVDKEGVPPGVNFMAFLAEAIAASRTVVAVYSKSYFSRPMCDYELTKTCELDPSSEQRKLTPILIDREAEGSLPLYVSGIHYIDATRDEWFERLCASLEMKPPTRPGELEFGASPAGVMAHHTLPRVRVALARDGRRIEETVAVTLTVEGGALQGTTAVIAEGGVAVFDDLLIGTVLDSTRLVATAEGFLPAFSAPFRVSAAPAAPAVKGAPVIGGRGAAIFFEDERALALVGAKEIVAYEPSGGELCRVQLDSRLRWVRRGGPYLFLGFWSGRVELLVSDGRRCRWDFQEPDGRYAVPGDLAVREDEAFLGMWDGRLFELTFERPAVLHLEHPAGVASIGVAGDRVSFVDLAGSLHLSHQGRVRRSHSLEPTVRGLKALADAVLVVGEKSLYRVPLPDGGPLRAELPLAGATEVLTEPELPVVLDREGKAVIFDEVLSIRRGFHAGPGARPISADRASRYCVVANRDGSRSLVDLTGADGSGATAGRVVFTQPEGALAVSPSGEQFAVGVAGGTRLVGASALQELIAERQGEA